MRSEIRRVCLFGGPGSGKSTTAHYIMWLLKSAGANAEFVHEFVKLRAYEGREVDPLAQPAVTSAQLDRELLVLEQADVDIMVTESPLLLGVVYDKTQEGQKHWLAVESEMRRRYPTWYIFIDRGHKSYEPKGRFETEHQAKVRDQQIRDVLNRTRHPYDVLPYGDWEAIKRKVYRDHS